MSESPPQSSPDSLHRFLRRATNAALRAFLRVVPAERKRLFALTVVIGAICGLAAVGFHSALRMVHRRLIERALEQPDYQWVAWTIVVPTVGALLAGVLIHFVVPAAQGSGVPQVKFIYAVKSGRVRLRDALGKFTVGLLQIGSGSSLGREGPTVQMCAGIASSLGRLFAISPHNLRRLLPVGSAAGIAAAFNAPIAAVTFTIEEIVGGLDQTLLSGVVVAAALAAAIERGVLGEHPVFDIPGDYVLQHTSSLSIYAGIGVAAALASYLFHNGLLQLRLRFRQSTLLPPWAKPAVGGLATGILAVVIILSFNTRGVTGDGYETLSAALSGQVELPVMLSLALAKLTATVLCYASGGAGGIFAPVLFIGGMIGGSFGHLDAFLLSHTNVNLGSFALVGMGAYFAAVIRAPITSVLIIFEMTGSYGLILPLMIANSVAFIIARQLAPVPIYEALLDQDGHHLPHTERTAMAISALSVADAMTTDLVTLSPDMTIEQAANLVRNLPYSVYPVVDEAGQLQGMITQSRLRRRVAEGKGEDALSAHAHMEPTLSANILLVDAINRMNKFGARQMVVVASAHSHLVLGMLAMSDVMRAHADVLNDRHPSHRAPVLTFEHPDSTAPGVPEDDSSRDSDRPP